jgi:hypothetical protein
MLSLSESTTGSELRGFKGRFRRSSSTAIGGRPRVRGADRGGGRKDAEIAKAIAGQLHWSTREPAGVVISRKNVIGNCAQMMCDYFEDPEGVSASSVSWLPFYHDMGLMQGVLMPMVN